MFDSVLTTAAAARSSDSYCEFSLSGGYSASPPDQRPRRPGRLGARPSFLRPPTGFLRWSGGLKWAHDGIRWYNKCKLPAERVQNSHNCVSYSTVRPTGWDPARPALETRWRHCRWKEAQSQTNQTEHKHVLAWFSGPKLDGGGRIKERHNHIFTFSPSYGPSY